MLPETLRLVPSLATGDLFLSENSLLESISNLLPPAGHPIKTIAEWLGDDPTTIEKTYAHNTPSMRAEMLAANHRTHIRIRAVKCGTKVRCDLFVTNFK